MDYTAKPPLKNPFASANFFSKIFFTWIIPLFLKGKRQDLNLEDLYDPLEDDLSGKLGDDLETEWAKRMKASKSKEINGSPSLLGALFVLLGKPYIICSIGLIIGELVFRMSQPILLRELIKSFSEFSQTSTSDQYLLALGLSFATFGATVFYHPSAFYLSRLSMRCRIALSSLIYRKILRLSTSAAYQKTNVGTIVNLLSNDVNRFDQNLIWVIFIPLGFIQLVVYSYLLWAEFGLPGLLGIGALVIFMPVQYFNSKLSAKYRLRIAQRTDERGRIMNEIITGIRILKMYAWEVPFSSVIHHLRKLEVVALKKRLYVRGMYFCLYSAAPKLFAFLTLLAYVMEGKQLSADQVFFTTSLYFTLCLTWVSNIPFAMAGIGELYVCFDRIRTFLQLEEKVPSPNFRITCNNENGSETFLPQINMHSIFAHWTQESPGTKLTLSSISMALSGDKVVCIVGPCGSGKSSLLHVILGELDILKGKATMQGSLSFAAQEPWVFAASVRQNILFGRPFIMEKYQKCVQAACLLDDFKQLPNGDNSIVGERGVSLSGGQKARVSLARCLYQEADIYLLDDPLSAVDTKVSRHLFENCIQRHLQGKLRILVTHQLQYLPQADHIIVLKDGKILAQGSYQELVDDKVDFVSLMAEEEDDTSNERNNSMSSGRRKSSAGHKQEVAEILEDVVEGNGKAEKMKEEAKASGSVGFRLYLDYFKMGRSRILLILTVLVFFICQLALSGVDYFLSFWTNAEVKNQDGNGSSLSADYLGRNTYIYIYTGLISFALAMSILRSALFLNYTTRIGVNVHNAMFSSLVRSRVKFFDENPSGRIMNRFTKDLGSMDELLPTTMLEMLTIFAQMIGVVVMVVVSNYYMAPLALVVIWILWIVRGVFVKTTRDIKRIEGITKSPIFSHCSTSFVGLETIRALRVEAILVNQFDALQDIHTSSWFLFFSSVRAFGICCELLSTLFLTVVSVSFLLMQDSAQIGNVGLAISAAMTLTGELQYGLRQSAEVENLMTSVERNLEYTHLPSEAPLESKDKPDTNWPSEGCIKFHNVSLSYHDDSDDENLEWKDKLVLKHLTFEIGAREKIGVVGRTGAGKSSIIQALFRLTEPRAEGKIFIDGVDVGEIGLHDLRKIISIIPQDPVLFSGTMRYNLDPFDEFPDEQLWTVISEVELRNAVPALDFKVADGGSNFSVGQRQLVCLARAILRKNKILVMDEATANVDPETDILIQKAIREKFAECTIITVAHRLHSVIDSDKILVLDNGYLKEYDSPHNLLTNNNGEDGIFKGMVEHLGKASADMLRKVAEQVYNERRPSQETSFL